MKQDQQKSQYARFDEHIFFTTSETYVHPTALLGDKVKLGTGAKIGPYCVITGDVTIGDRTVLYGHVTVGFPAQNIGTTTSLGTIHIGADTVLREFVSVHASKYEQGQTRIGDKCYIMSYSHVSHDVILEDNVTLINSVNLGGHTYIERNAILMANSATHQFCRVGQYTALAPFSGIRQDLPPFCMFDGKPAAFAGLNLIGLKRAGFSTSDIEALRQATRLFYQDALLLDDIKKQAALEPWGTSSLVETFLQFIERSSRGVSRRIRTREGHDQESFI